MLWKGKGNGASQGRSIVTSIAVFGDSILKGVVVSPDLKYRTLPEGPLKAVADRFGLSFSNRSRFGFTVTRGLEQLKKWLAQDGRADAVLLEYGGNDSNFDWRRVAASPREAHRPATPIDEFASKYREMIALLKEKDVTPVVMTLPPVHAQRYLDWLGREGIDRDRVLEFLGDTQMIYRYQEMYSNTAARIALETDCPLADVRQAFLTTDHRFEELIGADGIHPSEKGHQLIVDTLGRFAAEKFVA